MKNNSLIVKEENIFSKIIGFFKKIFGKKEVVEAPIVEEKIEKEDKKINNRESDFLRYIQINKKENPELLELQRKFEAKEILMREMTDEQLIELTALYKRQIEEINRDIENKKIRIGMLKFKVTGQMPGPTLRVQSQNCSHSVHMV